MRLGNLLDNPKRTGLLYLAIGGVSLAKAIALRNDRQRFRRELTDAAIFLGVGLTLRRYAAMKAEKRAELESMIPGWLGGEGSTSESGLRERATGRLRGGSESDAPSGIRARARSVIAD